MELSFWVGLRSSGLEMRRRVDAGLSRTRPGEIDPGERTPRLPCRGYLSVGCVPRTRAVRRRSMRSA